VEEDSLLTLLEEWSFREESLLSSAFRNSSSRFLTAALEESASLREEALLFVFEESLTGEAFGKLVSLSFSAALEESASLREESLLFVFEESLTA